MSTDTKETIKTLAGLAAFFGMLYWAVRVYGQ